MEWDESCSYAWAVICKNSRHHHRQNQVVGHKILLGESDSFESLPALPWRFPVRCDDCGRISCYRPSEVLRYQAEPPESFAAHPFFRNSPDSPPSEEGTNCSPHRLDTRNSLQSCPAGLFKSLLILLRLGFSQFVEHRTKG